MKKIRKHTQLSLLNPKRAGRKPIHDKGIRHIRRERFERESSFHITIKVREDKSDLQNKMILKALHHAIMKARAKSLKVIHYTLEYNHIHMLVEAFNQEQLSNCMQSFGVTLAKMINKVKFKKGGVYKHRYHLRRLISVMELKNVLKYIFNNGIKHKNSNTIMTFYNSAIVEKTLHQLYPKLARPKDPRLFKLQFLLFNLLDPGKIHYKGLIHIHSNPQ